ncbi:MAG: ATP synthase subunit I [Peptostreptococcaceae bacterium]|nr:ATP synthase subunit I [Peptostreptococcaceae bacterium]
MNDLTAFKNKIFLYGLIVMMVFEIVSLPLIGLDIKYTYGLFLGTFIAIANFNILAFTLKTVLSNGNKSFIFLGYFLRLALYGVAVVTAFKINNHAGFGSLLGFITVKISIYYLHGFKTKFSEGRKVRPEVQAEFDREDLEKEMKRDGRSEED